MENKRFTLHLYKPYAPVTVGTTILICHLNPTLMFLFVLLSVSGVQKAEEAEMKQMASTPHRSHVFSVANFDMIKSMQKKFITQVCAGVDDQLSSLASGEEGEMWWKSLLAYLVLLWLR